MVVQMCYVGPKEQGMEFLNAISSWDGERCLLNEVNEKSYLAQQDSVAQILRGKGRYPENRYAVPPDSLMLFMTAGRQWFIRSALIHSLPDETINQTVIQFANTPIGCSKYSQVHPLYGTKWLIIDRSVDLRAVRGRHRRFRGHADTEGAARGRVDRRRPTPVGDGHRRSSMHRVRGGGACPRLRWSVPMCGVLTCGASGSTGR